MGSREGGDWMDGWMEQGRETTTYIIHAYIIHMIQIFRHDYKLNNAHD